MINSVPPAHSHIIPIAVFSAQNQAGDRIIHIIAKIKIPLLLMIISPKNSNSYLLSSQQKPESFISNLMSGRAFLRSGPEQAGTTEVLPVKESAYALDKRRKKRFG